MEREKVYTYSKKIIMKIRQSIHKINNKIRESNLNGQRSIGKGLGKKTSLKRKNKQKQILTELKDLRLKAIKYIPDERLSQPGTASLLNLIGIIEVKIRLHKKHWEE